MWSARLDLRLDNTLHNARPHIFPHINRSMTAYLQAHLGLDEAAAGELRRHYWKRYGATLLGLMRHHATDPRHFLWHTHQFPELERHAGARAAAARDAAAPARPEVRVLQCAGALRARGAEGARDRRSVRRRVLDRAARAYRPKPDSYGFLRLCRANHLQAATLYHGGGHSRQPAHRRPARHEDGVGDPGGSGRRATWT